MMTCQMSVCYRGFSVMVLFGPRGQPQFILQAARISAAQDILLAYRVGAAELALVLRPVGAA
jgi:hypothetical protein